MRNLLPYEHALIDALGISEEEYFIFRKAQREYSDPKAGTILDARNGLETGTVALILSIVGTLASVASALLAPRPEAPEGPGSTRPRDRRFAPRYGFDSLQDLAQYGDPVNLVYTNKDSTDFANANGGVRVNTSLLWSAVYSHGNAQYIQMLAAIGASDIESISYPDTAVGQTLVRLFTRSSAWVYFRNQGAIVKNDLKRGNSRDPFAKDIAGTSSIYTPLVDTNDRAPGFSQAFSPSSASEFGITAPIPIKVNVFARNDNGNLTKDPLSIEMQDRGDYWPESYGNSRTLIPVGKKFKLSINKVKTERDNNEADNLSDEIRYACAESIELGSFYKLGSAKFQVINVSGDTALDTQGLTATLECIEAGYGPWEDYGTEDGQEREKTLEDQRNALRVDLDPTIKGSTAYNLANLRSSDYIAVSDLTTKQRNVLDSLQNRLDAIEILYEAIVSYKRNKTQMDELVRAAEDSFDAPIVQLANDIDDKEDELENKRDDKEKISSNIAQKGDPDGARTENLKAKKKEIAAIQKDLKKLRSQLAKALEQYGVADGVINSQLSYARNELADAKRQFDTGDFRDLLSGIKVPGNLDSGSSKAKDERLVLRQLKNTFHNLIGRIVAVKEIDYDKYTQEQTRLQTLIDQKTIRLDTIINQLKDPNSLNDYIGTKCLTKVVNATYETLSPIDLVHFAIKARVFMRIQGRASKYAETRAEKYKDADNGFKPRTAMFMVYYRNASSTTAEQREKDEGWECPNVIFCVRRTFDKEVFVPLTFKAPAGTERSKWEFKIEPIFDAPSEAKKKGVTLDFVYLESRESAKKIDPAVAGSKTEGIFYYRGYRRNPKPNKNNLPAKNDSPYGVDEWSIYSVRSDTSMQFSFDAGPEFKITAVSEQQYETATPDLYDNMSLIGLNAYSSAGLTNMRNLSVLVNKGKKVRTIQLSPASFPDSPDGASCFAPDIFLDTIIDGVNGIGQYLDANSKTTGIQALIQDRVDIGGLALAKAFCNKYKYYMDGVIADRTSWRSFWSEVAPYSLLELARIGGKETLIPAVPVTGDGTRTRNVTISALFNQGNILEGSYKEEFLDYGESTQDLIATVVYRDQASNQPFPRNTSVTVQLKDALENVASRRTFDLSAFVTNRDQAIDYAMLLVRQRRYSRRAVEFQTFPTEAPIAPGAYIYVQVDDNRWDDIRSGSVLDDGTINVPFAEEVINGTYDTLIYKPGESPIKTSITYVNGQSSAFAAYAGTGALFVLGSQVSSKRVFRVVEIAMGEEGEISVKAVEHQCIEEGGQTKSMIAYFDRNAAIYKIS
jgi:hypothetical protein